MFLLDRFYEVPRFAISDIHLKKKRAHLSPKDPVKIKQFFLLHHKLLESRYLHFFFCHRMIAIETTAKKIMNSACISKVV